MADGAFRATAVDVDGVRMQFGRQTRVAHASDAFGDADECFGGDTMGHWNVGRINRILDACVAPVVLMPIPRANMLDMARVGKPDPARAKEYAAMGAESMPPLSFVSIPDVVVGAHCMMVDGHHRLLALYFLGVDTVKARILPPQLVGDVRIVEITEVATFPSLALPSRSLNIDAHPLEMAHV